MPVKLSCSCGNKLRVRDDLIGKKVKCPGCGQALVAEAPVLARNRYVFKEQAKLLSSRKAFDLYNLLDGETGELIGSVRQKPCGLPGLLLGKDNAPVTLEVRGADSDRVVFAVRRRGLFSKKVEAVGGRGQVVGSYVRWSWRPRRRRAMRFKEVEAGRLVFKVYDGAGKYFAQLNGKWLKDEALYVVRSDGTTFHDCDKWFKEAYHFLTPEGAEMGVVTKNWSGALGELFASESTCGVRVSRKYAADRTAKILLLGAALVIYVLSPKG